MTTNTASRHRHSRHHAGSYYDVEEELQSVQARVANTIHQLRKHIEDPREVLVWETLDAIRDGRGREKYQRLRSSVQQSLGYLEEAQDDLDELDLRNASHFRFFLTHRADIEDDMKDGLGSLRDLVSFRNALEYRTAWVKVVTAAMTAHLESLKVARRRLDARFNELITDERSNRSTAAIKCIYDLIKQYEGMQRQVKDDHDWWYYHCQKSPQHQEISSEMDQVYQRLSRRVERCVRELPSSRERGGTGPERRRHSEVRRRQSLHPELPDQGLGAIFRWVKREIQGVLFGCFDGG